MFSDKPIQQRHDMSFPKGEAAAEIHKFRSNLCFRQPTLSDGFGNPRISWFINVYHHVSDVNYGYIQHVRRPQPLRVPTEAASCPWTEAWEWEGVFHVHYGPLAQNLAVSYGWGFLGHKKYHEVPPVCLLAYGCGFETHVEIDLDIYLDAKIE